MPKFDESVINFAVYEDSVEYLGMAKATLPTLPLLRSPFPELALPAILRL